MPDPTEATSPSRHDRFRAIMDAAAGTSTADYMSHPRFWRLPLNRLDGAVALLRGAVKILCCQSVTATGFPVPSETLSNCGPRSSVRHSRVLSPL